MVEIDKIYNLAAEKNLIGSILLKNDSICEIIDMLKPEDFYSSKHKIIFAKLKEMYEDRIPIDVVTLCDKLGKRLKEVGGITYITELINASVTAVNIKRHGEIIKEKSNYREILKIFNTSLDKLKEGKEAPDDIVYYAQNSLLNLNTLKAKEGENMLEIMGDFMDTLQKRYEKGGELQGIKSGYKHLDKMLGGLQKQDLIILAARPSMGKTTMAVNMVLNAVFKGDANVAFFNLEMGKTQIIDRTIAAYTEIPLDNIKNAELSDKQWVNLSEAAAKLSMANIKLYDKIFQLEKIKSECRRIKIEHGLDIAVIDHLQLIGSGEKTENRTQEISKITRKLKLMAKELDINLILLSQLSRAPECRSDHRPMLSDLRESGSIEQDADTVIFLYRDEYYFKDSDSKGIIECIVAKNRNGEVGTARLKWKPEIQRIW
ncbi:replicative DNA helicase [Clostridiaceae bacterium UIB06]|uniref:Replicative DNA helicase n=1 Tax=Clostridium thailandense TaxID=2794346 RepID=A0A949TK87_9CLOT|nr:replicative DNA helicase [Clostridium thailandense]MBV7273840.1 replicative DNA helicase [Clostridium thailandense]MCH5136895.1 replicative DNA helicase [Clostridiaceae bacterium UIB06]